MLLPLSFSYSGDCRDPRSQTQEVGLIFSRMEDLPPISVIENDIFCVEMMKRLNIQRKQGHLCDLTLVTKDDEELKAHSNVLSAASPFFNKLLLSDMKEKREGIVRFEEISGSVMEDVLEFVYTGTVGVTQENAKELIAAGNYLIIPSLETVSGRFLEGEMSNKNCISTFYFAEKYQCNELLTNSRGFIHENFACVAEMDEFLNLEAKEVERWISSDKIVVTAELDVFKIVQKWVEHSKSERKAAFEELFRHVRLVFLPRDYLLSIVTNELVRDNGVCLRLISDAIQLTAFSNEHDLPLSPRKGLETRAIVACGGKYTFCYIPEEDEWKRLPDGLSERNQKNQVIRYQDQLYVFPRYCPAERYDPVYNGWSTLDFSSNSATVVVIKGEIYALEIDTLCEESTIKRYNVDMCSWQTVLTSNQACRIESCVVAAGHHLYSFGGWLPQSSECVTKAERFDTMVNEWEEIADMQCERGGAFGVATEEKIFVGGGHRSNYVWRTCEMYIVSTNEWQTIASLNISHEYGSMMCLKGKIYVVGGSNILGKNELKVECYDPTKDKWIIKTTIPMKKICRGNKHTFTGCVLKFSKGVLDKLEIVKTEN